MLLSLENISPDHWPSTHTLKFVSEYSCMTQVHFNLLSLHWDLEWMSLFVRPSRVKAWFAIALGLYWLKPHWLSNPDIMGSYLSSVGPQVWANWCEAWSPSLHKEDLCVCSISSHLWVITPRLWILTRVHFSPSD